MTTAWCYGSALTVDHQDGRDIRCPFCGDQVETFRGLIVEHCPEPWPCSCGAHLSGSAESSSAYSGASPGRVGGTPYAIFGPPCTAQRPSLSARKIGQNVGVTRFNIRIDTECDDTIGSEEPEIREATRYPP